jgi:hypothetical protein
MKIYERIYLFRSSLYIIYTFFNYSVACQKTEKQIKKQIPLIVYLILAYHEKKYG